MLPDEILLAIFAYFVDEDAFRKKDVEAWLSLVHVCRRWRRVTFGSPRRLNLRLFCGPKTPVMDALDIWPPLPLVVRGGAYDPKGVNNLLAGLQLSDRVYQINLWGHSTSPMKKVLAGMLQPFPELTDLVIKMPVQTVRAPPDSFLGGSSPHLRKLQLYGISFPDLPILLFSATHLVDLQLCNIPNSGYISPEAMATALSTLPSLQLLSLKFLFSQSHPDSESQPPPPTCSLLPALDTLRFKGVAKYLDDLMARVSAPRLNILDVAFFNLDVFDATHVLKFIGRTSALGVLEAAHVTFQLDSAGVKLSSATSGYRELSLEIPFQGLELQLLLLGRFVTLCLPPLSTSEDLYIYENIYPQPEWWPTSIEDTRWLELLRPFTAVKKLYLSEKIASRIVPTLQELVGGRITEVFPALENFFLEGLQPWGPVQESIGKFIAARQLSNHPITVSSWDRDVNMRNQGVGFDER